MAALKKTPYHFIYEDLNALLAVPKPDQLTLSRKGKTKRYW